MMTPPRLHRKVEKKPLLSRIPFIQIMIILALILFFLLFLIVCFIAVPKTFGFYWW